MAFRTCAATEHESINLTSDCNNIRGFVALPTEILYRIVSTAQGPIIPWMNESAMDKKYAERRDSLSALCQGCRSLRAVFLPLLWESLEACCLPGDQKNQYDRWLLLEKKLVDQLQVINVIQPLYASYIKIVNIAIEPVRSCNMLLGLAPALALMPDLHTIQITIQPYIPLGRSCIIYAVGSETFKSVFKDLRYPSVKRAILPEQSMSILDCFPEVREVYLNQPYHKNFFLFLKNLARSCSKLEKFGWIEFERENNSRATAIVEKLPGIRELEYHLKDFNTDEISQLARLQNLENLSLVIDKFDDLSQCDDAVLEAIEAAKKVLLASPHINKHLNVKFRAEVLFFTAGDN